MTKIVLVKSSPLLSPVAFAEHSPTTPGAGNIVLAHNAYPDTANTPTASTVRWPQGRRPSWKNAWAWIEGQSLSITTNSVGNTLFIDELASALLLRN